MIDSNLKNANILLVDDQQANIDILHDFLQMQGYTNIESITDSREVAQLILDFDPDIILLDLMMPYLSGFDIMELLKTIVPASTYLPILVLTADVTLETKRKALQSGASDFLSKPFDLIELSARVNTHLQIRFKNEQINNYSVQLEKLIATKDKFFSIIAHDLRNPFVGIENFTKILMKLGKYDPLDMESQLKTIHSTAQHGHELLENLLRWARSQTDRIEINSEVFRLCDAVRNCISLLQTQADNKQVKLLCNVSEEILIDSDQDVLETIIRNLMSNALKYSNALGSVTINAENSADEIEISISDTGVGIPEDVQINLFRIDNKLQSQKGTAGEKGSGLGLILCKEFIDKLGGTISVKSEVGKGTTFSFRLPNVLD
ncbi:MAG: ATP-binding protein [Paludibacter sp.]|jgi:two-component system, sensor histidine kinase and response regulator